MSRQSPTTTTIAHAYASALHAIRSDNGRAVALADGNALMGRVCSEAVVAWRMDCSSCVRPRSPKLVMANPEPDEGSSLLAVRDDPYRTDEGGIGAADELGAGGKSMEEAVRKWGLVRHCSRGDPEESQRFHGNACEGGRRDMPDSYRRGAKKRACALGSPRGVIPLSDTRPETKGERL